MGGLGPLLLVAEREFRAYVATASFWVALLIGPVLMAAGGLVFEQFAAAKPPVLVDVKAAEPALAARAAEALVQAGTVEDRVLRAAPGGFKVSITRASDGAFEAQFPADFPLSRSGQALALALLERDDARARAVGVKPLTVRNAPVSSPGSSRSAQPGRFILVMLLWLPLTGSLGMLLQAIVRERSNRALETLLAAVRPWQVVMGKLAGVGLVSGLVMATWLGSGALAGGAFGFVAPFPSLLRELSDPVLIAQAVTVYGLAFLFYGLATIALGASAQDATAAQNYVRPLFAVLLCAFFAALAVASGARGLDWLVYLPPFSPFLLLLTDQEPATQAAAVGILTLGTLAAGGWAVRSVGLGQARPRRR